MRHSRKSGDQASWDSIFASPDPWSYEDLYERTKRGHALEALPQERFGRALEIGCAEGHFTEALAPRVGHLVAVDISSVALARAKVRCRHLSNVEFLELDAFRELPGGGYELIVCSEVLYYAKNRLALN